MAKVIRLRRSKNYTPALIIFLCFIILALAWLITPTTKMLEARRENFYLNRELTSVRHKNAQLRKSIKQLKTDEYIELEARKQLGLIKPSEKAYVVVPGKAKPEKKKPPKPKSWWQKTVDFFKGLF